MQTPMLDHVAIRVLDREATTAQLLRRLDWRVIEQTERFTLLGADPDAGKLTLLDAEGPERPEPVRLVSVVLAEASGEGVAPLALECGLVATFVEPAELGPGYEHAPRHALVGVSLRAPDPPIAAARLEAEHGMRVDAVGREHAVVDVGHEPGSGRITLSRERWEAASSPLLDHVGVRVADARAWRARAERTDVPVVRWVEAPHSQAVFVTGPDDLLLEFVELTRPLEQE